MNEYNGYCCDGSIITSDGSEDISKLVCCEGDPIDNSIDLRAAATCTAGSAVPLTQVPTIPVTGYTIVGVSTTVSRASVTAMAGNTASVVSSGRSDGSVLTPTSMAMAAATSSGIGLPTVPRPGVKEGIIILVVGWLMGGH